MVEIYHPRDLERATLGGFSEQSPDTNITDRLHQKNSVPAQCRRTTLTRFSTDMKRVSFWCARIGINCVETWKVGVRLKPTDHPWYHQWACHSFGEVAELEDEMEKDEPEKYLQQQEKKKLKDNECDVSSCCLLFTSAVPRLVNDAPLITIILLKTGGSVDYGKSLLFIFDTSNSKWEKARWCSQQEGPWVSMWRFLWVLPVSSSISKTCRLTGYSKLPKFWSFFPSSTCSLFTFPPLFNIYLTLSHSLSLIS